MDGVKCRTCSHGVFLLTPTGRIKKNEHGRCGEQKALLEMFSVKRAAPCIVLTPPHPVSIWPDYDASKCPMYSAKGKQ